MSTAGMLLPPIVLSVVTLLDVILSRRRRIRADSNARSHHRFGNRVIALVQGCVGKLELPHESTQEET